MFPVLRVRAVFQKQLAGYIGGFPKVRRIFLGLTEGQKWCSLSCAGMNQIYRLHLMQNLDDALIRAAMALSWCGRKTDQQVIFPQDEPSAPQSEMEKQSRVDYSVDFIES